VRQRAALPLRLIRGNAGQPSELTGQFRPLRAGVQDYARALISVQPSVTDDVVTARLAARMERQRLPDG
jgi:hypothetical protein